MIQAAASRGIIEPMTHGLHTGASAIPLAVARERYESFKARGLSLDLTRGKPASAQLALSAGLVTSVGAADTTAEGKVDIRNYGGLQGLVEARRLFEGLMGAPADQIVIGNNSSLALMHDTVVYALLKGTTAGGPWAAQDGVTFLCPVPGYDRHFTICETYGIRMVPVPLHDDGPDMDEVERLVAGDASIKGIWTVPKYSNPTGAVYSDAVVERLASMQTAAPDFRIFWDNAYSVHHLTETPVEIADILAACARHGHPDRAFVFASTSKITLAGAGLALFASSPANVKWLLARMTARTIGPDKINQLRHVRFLRNAAGIGDLMARHRTIIAPKFQAVLDTFAAELDGVAGVRWTRPKGGYFIALDVPEGTARQVVALAKAAGIALTPAGSTHPYGKDPDDRVIRIAPTFPELAEVVTAAEGVAVCVRLASAERG